MTDPIIITISGKWDVTDHLTVWKAFARYGERDDVVVATRLAVHFAMLDRDDDASAVRPTALHSRTDGFG